MALGAAENDQLLGVEESKASGFKVWGVPAVHYKNSGLQALLYSKPSVSRCSI